jgi:hypothetical protein
VSAVDEKPVWMEDWFELARDRKIVDASADGQTVLDLSRPDRLRLALAAPKLVRALLAVEWCLSGLDVNCCHACAAYRNEGTHSPGCSVDAALTAAGLETREARAAARAATTRKSPEQT